MSRTRSILLVLLLFVYAGTALAQGNPTGTLTGRVTDPDDLALPGVTVTVKSAILQGLRSVVTSSNGDYIIPFLPAGGYEVTFEITGFAPTRRAVTVQMADRTPLNVKLRVAALTEQVEVTAEASEIAKTPTLATTVKASSVELIPLGRTLEAATLLAPSANNNGPEGQITVSGGLSYDSLNLVNGVNINDTQRQQARVLYVEDAIQETKVSAASISAEYGRFQGGVINMVTKSGGNTFSGSFRTTFTNDGWKSLTPYPGDANVDKIVPAYEATFGGPIVKDKIWFFSAARLQKNSTNQTTPFTSFNYTKTTDDRRAEGKLTYAINRNNTFKVSYLWKKEKITNDNYETILDEASLFNDQIPESLLAANYQSVLRSNLFVEAQYSSRKKDTQDYGSQSTDLIKGTPIWDRSRGNARFNTSTYCAVCPDYVNLLNNWDAYAKVNYFLSTQSRGTHSLVAGFDLFNDMRKNNQNTTASGYRIRASGAVIQGQSVTPIFRTGRTTFIDWRPVFQPTKGNELRTYSAFLNDVWRVNKRLTMNLGVRFDKNSTRNQGDELVGDASTWSPRVSANWDVRGDGKWTANASFAHYVAMFMTQVADAASPAGREAGFSYFYAGPSINDGPGPYLNTSDALRRLFDWFFANGGSKLPFASPPTVPGVSTAVDPGIRSESTDEFAFGLTREFGKGSLRADFFYRRFGNIYGNFTDMSTGIVTDPGTAQRFNLTVVNNTDRVHRSYKGMSLQGAFRPRPGLQVSGNYMLSFTKGNVEADNFNSIVGLSDTDTYPEYRQENWNYPEGYLNSDQRHKVRVWATYSLPVSKSLGNATLGLMQRFDSGRNYDYNMTVDTRPYVTNPGYLTPPSSVNYYVSGRGEFRFDGTFRTDLSLSWNRRIARDSEIFLRFVANNVLNSQRLDGYNTTILGPTNDSTLAAFNPFTTKPIEGVNWKKGPVFGQPTGPESYQSPRDFNVSIGFRF